MLVTDTIVIEDARKSEIAWLTRQVWHGGLARGAPGQGLAQGPEGGEKGAKMVFDAAKAVYERGHVAAAHPDFVRLLTKVKPSASPNQPLWNHDNPGDPGVTGADVAARAAWTITRGRAEVRVAVLDEGVDTEHPALKPPSSTRRISSTATRTPGPTATTPTEPPARASSSAATRTYPGLAPECSLVAVRIAKGDGTGNWIFDDFATADAIDWAWQEGKADVLSNSWGGGPAVDVVSRAIERARTKGRQGRGAVVVFAAGNDNGPVNFPRTIEEVITVGASNQWDERKSPDVARRRELVGEQLRQAPRSGGAGSANRHDRHPWLRPAIPAAISRSPSTARPRPRPTWPPRRP